MSGRPAPPPRPGPPLPPVPLPPALAAPSPPAAFLGRGQRGAREGGRGAGWGPGGRGSHLLALRRRLLLRGELLLSIALPLSKLYNKSLKYDRS